VFIFLWLRAASSIESKKSPRDQRSSQLQGREAV
jgi:hypothetical protein